MSAPRFIEIRACPGRRSGGKRHLWRDIIKLRQEQRRAAAKAQQPALFELRETAARDRPQRRWPLP